MRFRYKREQTASSSNCISTKVSAITAGMDSLSTFGLKSELKPVDQQREFEGLMRMLDNKVRQSCSVKQHYIK